MVQFQPQGYAHNGMLKPSSRIIAHLRFFALVGEVGKFPSQVPHTLKTSSGVFHPKHFRGLLLILFTISSNSLLLR
ncbi:MAG: hypothetical protein ACOX8U_10710, partial [Bradymonadia bacterium]